jgi:hypothetical protein
MPGKRQQNSTAHPIPLLFIDAVDRISGVPNPSVTAFRIAKDGGGWGDPVGELVVHAEALGCVPVDDKYDIVAYDPFAATSLPAAERTAIADAVLTRDWTQVVSWPQRCALQALRFLRNKWFVAPGGALTVYAENDTTVAWTGTVQTQGGADPITGQTPTS